MASQHRFLLRRCAQLQHLDLCGCGGVRGTFLLRAAGHENLQSLLLGNCGALGSAVVRRPSRASRRVHTPSGPGRKA